MGSLTFTGALAGDTFEVGGVTFTLYGHPVELAAAANPAGILRAADDSAQAKAAALVIVDHPAIPGTICTKTGSTLVIAGRELVGGPRIVKGDEPKAEATAAPTETPVPEGPAPEPAAAETPLETIDVDTPPWASASEVRSETASEAVTTVASPTSRTRGRR